MPERKPDETIEGRLANLIEMHDVIIEGLVDGYLSDNERTLIVKCLRERARWMSSDIYAGERPGRKRQRR